MDQAGIAPFMILIEIIFKFEGIRFLLRQRPLVTGKINSFPDVDLDNLTVYHGTFFPENCSPIGHNPAIDHSCGFQGGIATYNNDLTLYSTSQKKIPAKNTNVPL